MSDEEKEWSATPTDLGGWANRAMKMLAERDRLRERSEMLEPALDSARAEVARLREALERLLDNGESPHPLSGRDPTVRWEDVEHAHQALGGTSDE